ncbi:hypothetical protein [Pantoea sp.]|uniref:hypothetical protein n=1 Tax=Pantoea sp. TaxID=69393 RepID=UPI0028A9918B|nr:hypothetical protein [Pantoea sp.]
MNASDYLRLKFSAEKELSLTLEKGIKGTAIGAYNTLDDVYHGIERASWYSSCFFDNYQDVCKEIGHEDLRMLKAIKELYRRRDIIAFMIDLYIKYLFSKYEERPTEAANHGLKKTAGVVAGIVAARATNKAFSYAIAEAIANATNTTLAVKNRVGSMGMIWFSAAQMYGKNQKSAMAARRLRMSDPGYYRLLYRANLEMLYVYIEPIISDIINDIKRISKPTAEDIAKVLKEYT